MRGSSCSALGPTPTDSRRDPGSLALVAAPADVGPPTLDARPLSSADAPTIGALHDRLFPRTHTTGSSLVSVASPETPPSRRRARRHPGRLRGG